MLMAIGDRARPEHEQIGLRLGSGLDDHRVLGRDHGAIAEPCDEQPGGVDHTAGVPRADRRHLDDLALDQLDPLARMEDADLRHTVVFLDREQSARDLHLDGHCQPPGYRS